MSETSAGTGRLFRSLRAEGGAADAAIPALSLDEAVGLRTVTLGAGADSPAVVPAPTAPVEAVAIASAVAPVVAPVVVPASVETPGLEYAEVAPRLDAHDDAVPGADVAAASVAA